MNHALDLLLVELRAQRDASVRHFESLDTKAGIMLGFSGALAALSTPAGYLVAVGRASSVAAAAVALGAMLPRRFPVLYGEVLRRRHTSRAPDIAAAGLVDELIRTQALAARVLRSKARLLLIAGSLVLLAVAFIGAELISA